MKAVINSSWALLLGIGLLQVGNSLQGTLLGVRGKLEGFDASLMGYVMAGYFIGFLGGSALTPLLIRRVGHVRVFAALGSLISAAFIIYAVAVDPLAWGLMRFLVGFCFSGVYVVAESWLNASATNESRGQALSAYLMIQMAGIIAGQFLINLADPGGYDLFVLMSVVVSISFAPMLLSAAPAPVYDSSERMSFRELFRISPLGCVGTLILGGVFAAMFGMSAVYAGEKGFSLREISVFIATIYVGAIVLQYPIGWLSDRMDRRTVIAFTAALGAAGCALGLVAGDSWWMMLLGAALIGGSANPLYSLLIAHTNDFLAPNQMAAASSGLVFLNGVGSSVGPIVVGYAMGLLGPDGYFVFILALFTMIALYALYRMTRRAAPEETGSYAPMAMRGTAVAAEMAAEIYAEDAGSAQTQEERADGDARK